MSVRSCRSRAMRWFGCSLALALALVVIGGWGAPGHRTITRLAIDLLPDSMPDWVRDPDLAGRVAFQSNEPDRWRGTRLPALADENNGDHYIDAELLGAHGLSLRTLPRLRSAYIAAIVTTPPPPPAPPAEGEAPGAPTPAQSPEDVGLLPYAISEHYAKLTSSFNTLRILERLDDPARATQVEQARANAIYHMGQLSHFVGDAAQPLHTTIHHHGWVGENPKGYTEAGGFHRYIDSEIVALHALNLEGLTPYRKPIAEIEPTEDGVWEATIALIERGHDSVEPLYALQKSGELQHSAGRAFIGWRMADAASVLAGLYHAAWVQGEPNERQVRDFEQYNAMGAEEGWSRRNEGRERP